MELSQPLTTAVISRAMQSIPSFPAPQRDINHTQSGMACAHMPCPMCV